MEGGLTPVLPALPVTPVLPVLPVLLRGRILLRRLLIRLWGEAAHLHLLLGVVLSGSRLAVLLGVLREVSHATGIRRLLRPEVRREPQRQGKRPGLVNFFRTLQAMAAVRLCLARVA